MTTSEKLMIRFLAFALLAFSSGLTLSQEPTASAKPTQPTKLTTQQARDSFKKLGVNKNASIPESSGLAISSVKDAVWTINDSGKGDKTSLLLLHQNGKLLDQVFVDAKNVDWEAMSRAFIDKQPWLVIADVGDNLQRRLKYQLYLTPEPVFRKADASNLEERNAASTTKVELTFSSAGTHPNDLAVLNKKPEQKKRAKNSKPINCEAIAVDPLTNDIWFVEKVYINSDQKTAPGIFALPLPKSIVKTNDVNSPEHHPAAKIQMAERIGDFPIRNVTGMAFSPDGNKLLIRNYFGAHLYRRREKESWRQTIKRTKPIKVAIPLQRQGEAVCFTPDSNSIILTSEVVNQPVWRVGLTDYYALPLRLRDASAR